MDFECLGVKEFVHYHIPALAGWDVPGPTPCAQCKTMPRTSARNPPWWLQCAGSCMSIAAMSAGNDFAAHLVEGKLATS